MTGAVPVLKPSITVGHGSGQPAGMPDFYPVNPWGRDMPKPERPPRPPLYQVVVLDKRRGNAETRVGPMCPHENAAMLCEAINQQIALGAEKQWTDPIVLKMTEGVT